MTKNFNNFKMTVERNWFTSKTLVRLDPRNAGVFTTNLKVGEEKEVINKMIWELGNEPTYEDAREYFLKHPENFHN